MVLQDFSEPSSDFSSSDSFTPSSSPDPYNPSAPSDSGITYNFDLSQFPHPIWPYTLSQERLSRLISSSASHAFTVLGRPPTSDEIQALAFYNLQSIAIASYGLPVGTLAGLGRWWVTREQFKWPFVKPKPNLDPQVWPGQSATWLRGASAIRMHQVTRMGVYIALGQMFGSIFGGAYAASVGAAGVATDTRLKFYVQQLKAYNQERMRGRQKEMSERAQGRMQGPPVRQNPRADDASPTGRVEIEDVYAGDANSNRWEGASGSDSGMMNDGQMVRTQQTPIQTQTPRRSGFSRTPQPPQDPNCSNQHSSSQSPTVTDEFIPSSSTYDDASPTAGPPASSSTPQAGAWDRIRKNAEPSSNRRGIGGSRVHRQPGAQQPQDQQDTSGGDSFSFSKGDEERQLAKDQAQRDFDQMVERERRGDEASGGGGGWRR